MEIKQGQTEEQYDFALIKSENAFATAVTLGLDVVTPASNELQLDIDNEDGMLAYRRNAAKFQLHIAEFLEVIEKPSKSGEDGKLHITIVLDRDVTPEERILCQLMLGSDRTRETLSYIRYLNDDPNPTLFYEKRPLLLESGPTEYAGDNS